MPALSSRIADQTVRVGGSRSIRAEMDPAAATARFSFKASSQGLEARSTRRNWTQGARQCQMASQDMGAPKC